MYEHTSIVKKAQGGRNVQTKRVLLSMLIVTIDPSKDAEKFIADVEAVCSNIKLLTNSPLDDKQLILREPTVVGRVPQ